jgi:hypothetical protein
LVLGWCLIAGILLSYKGIGSWREAFSGGFTAVTTTKVVAFTFLALICWLGVFLQNPSKRQ